MAAYLPDHLPANSERDRKAALELADGADILVHDAQSLHHERDIALAYGHSTIAQAMEFATEAGVGVGEVADASRNDRSHSAIVAQYLHLTSLYAGPDA